jgi:hypothetical protein
VTSANFPVVSDLISVIIAALSPWVTRVSLLETSSG